MLELYLKHEALLPVVDELKRLGYQPIPVQR